MWWHGPWTSRQRCRRLGTWIGTQLVCLMATVDLDVYSLNRCVLPGFPASAADDIKARAGWGCSQRVPCCDACTTHMAPPSARCLSPRQRQRQQSGQSVVSRQPSAVVSPQPSALSTPASVSVGTMGRRVLAARGIRFRSRSRSRFLFRFRFRFRCRLRLGGSPWRPLALGSQPPARPPGERRRVSQWLPVPRVRSRATEPTACLTPTGRPARSALFLTRRPASEWPGVAAACDPQPA